MNGPENKEFDDLPKYLDWMTRAARCLVPAAYAEDIAVMALYKAYTPTKSRPPAEDEKRVKAWLWTILKFEALTFRKSQARSIEMHWDDPIDALDVAESVDHETAIANRQRIRIALDDLTNEQRDLVIKCDIEGMTVASFARDSGLPEETVRSRLQRAHELMRSKLDASDDEDRKRQGVFLPLWGFSELENWTDRIRSVWRRFVHRPMRWAMSIAAGVCIMGFIPHHPETSDNEPLALTIFPEPMGENREMALELNAKTGTTATVTLAEHVHESSNPTEKPTSDDGDGLLVRAKASLNRRDAKRALEFLAEHERRFPNSKMAGYRKQLQAVAMKLLSAKR